jgi:EAL domain-containing protein (putative c-di-GMP-specific phosphodiesterase class I)
MAHALELKIVAEGVENLEHLQRVQDSGSDLAQGFFFGKLQEYLETI